MSARDSSHPAYETLLLWQAAELEEPAAVATHLEICQECRDTLASSQTMLDAIRELVDGPVSAGRADAGDGSPLVDAEVQARRNRRRRARRRVAVSAVCMTVFMLGIAPTTPISPAARADELLFRATTQGAVGQRPFDFRLSTSADTCDVRRQEPSVAVLPEPALCDAAAVRFRSVRWSGNAPLSAHAFQRWRDGIEARRDSVRVVTGGTELTTETDVNPLRRATIEFRDGDYRPVRGRFEFSASSSRPALSFDVIALEVPIAAPAAPAGVMPVPREKEVRLAGSSPTAMDAREAEVRLLLHDLGFDVDVLIAVEQRGTDVRVRGAIADGTRRDRLFAALQSPGVVIAVDDGSRTDGEPAYPWEVFQGDAPALAHGQIADLFAGEPGGRQDFVNDLDRLSRRVVAAARSRSALQRLVGTALPSAQLTRLTRAIADLDQSQGEALVAIAARLQPLLGSSSALVAQRVPMQELPARQLYDTVHQLVFLSRTDSTLTREAAVQQLQALLH